MFNERVFVITGAAGGTGKAAARALAERGASLALLGSDQTRLDSLAGELNLPAERILTHAADLRQKDSVRSTAEAVTVKFGRVDGLIHLVGGWTGGRTLAEADAFDFESMLDQHAWTTFHLFQAFGPRLAANRWGRVIVVSSSTVPKPPGKAAAYTAAKAAQENLVLSLAAELREFGVTANIIQVRAIDAKGEGKGTTPAEIVAAMLYLCSEQAGKVSGARVPLFG